MPCVSGQPSMKFAMITSKFLHAHVFPRMWGFEPKPCCLFMRGDQKGKPSKSTWGAIRSHSDYAPAGVLCDPRAQWGRWYSYLWPQCSPKWPYHIQSVANIVCPLCFLLLLFVFRDTFLGSVPYFLDKLFVPLVIMQSSAFSSFVTYPYFTLNTMCQC